MPRVGPRLSAGSCWSRRRGRAFVIVLLGMLVALGVAGTGVVSGPGGGAARAVSRPVASPASCGPTQGVCPAQVVVGTGAWCWFADPRAVHIDRGGIDEVVVGWLTPTGQVMVETIDAHGRARQTEISHDYADDHNSPTISVEPDNRITVYWSVHNGARLYYETTLHPGDISSWSHWRDLPSNTPGRWGFTYPNPVILPAEANRHYLFWRGGDWEPSFSTRTNTGQWSPARVLINFPGRRPYTKVASNGRDRIALAFTDGHPDNNVTSIYFAEIHGGGLYSAAGQYLGRLGSEPIVPSARTTVYDARANGTVRSWLQDVAFDRAGHPIIAYSIYPRGQDGQYWYARWDGHRWLRHFVVDGRAIDRPRPAPLPRRDGARSRPPRHRLPLHDGRRAPAVAALDHPRRWPCVDGHVHDHRRPARAAARRRPGAARRRAPRPRRSSCSAAATPTTGTSTRR